MKTIFVKFLWRLQKFAFIRLLIKSYAFLMLRFFCSLLPRISHSVYLKGGFTRSDWDFVLSDIDLVIFLQIEDLDTLEKFKKVIYRRRCFFRLLCPWLWDIDVWRQDDAGILFGHEPFYKLDAKNWKLLSGIDLRKDAYFAALTPYDYLEVIYFYLLWFGKKWQRVQISGEFREDKSLRRLLFKWKGFLESLDPNDKIEITNLPQYDCFLLLVNSSLAIFNKSFNLKSYDTLAMNKAGLFCTNGQKVNDFSDGLACYVDAPEKMMRKDNVLSPFALWIPDELFWPMAHLGVIRLWELREYYIQDSFAVPDELVKKLYIRCLRFWIDWGRREPLFDEWLKRVRVNS